MFVLSKETFISFFRMPLNKLKEEQNQLDFQSTKMSTKLSNLEKEAESFGFK